MFPFPTMPRVPFAASGTPFRASKFCLRSRLPRLRIAIAHPPRAPLHRNESVVMRRVAVTGMGVICALGHNLDDTWKSLRNGQSGIAPLSLTNGTELRFKNGAEVRGYDGARH